MLYYNSIVIYTLCTMLCMQREIYLAVLLWKGTLTRYWVFLNARQCWCSRVCGPCMCLCNASLFLTEGCLAYEGRFFSNNTRVWTSIYSRLTSEWRARWEKLCRDKATALKAFRRANVRYQWWEGSKTRGILVPLKNLTFLKSVAFSLMLKTTINSIRNLFVGE